MQHGAHKDCSLPLLGVLLATPLYCTQVAARSGEAIDIEACFSQLTLDVIGKAVFNYDFNALNTDSPLIQVGRGTSPLPALPHCSLGRCSCSVTWVISNKFDPRYAS